MSVSVTCAACSETINVGDSRRPSSCGPVHERCKPDVHVPRDTSGLTTYALVFAADKLRVFKRPASPFRDGPTARDSEWRHIDTVESYEGTKVDIRGATWAHESGVTVLYADTIS